MTSDLAPICIFVYNRPWHTEKMLASLVANKLFSESEVFVFADGPKSDAPLADIEKIKQVRNKLKILGSNTNIHYNLSETNKGLTKSIISGITDIVNKFGKVIVVEDDLELSIGFLQYMNDALNYYENEEQVMHIGGYMVPHQFDLPETFFLRPPTIWGWGTWKRAWENYEVNAGLLLEKLEEKFGKEFAYKFDINGTYTYTKQLADIASGKLDTWDIQWTSVIYLNSGLCLHPKNSLSRNNGFDGSGVHCYPSDLFKKQVLENSVKIKSIPMEINETGVNAFIEFFKAQNNEEEMKFSSSATGIVNRIKQMVKKIIS